jgi:hypothetical protein
MAVLDLKIGAEIARIRRGLCYKPRLRRRPIDWKARGVAGI